MKAIGLGAAGLGAAAATTPVFHDLDEMSGTSKIAEKRPWWVKERDYLDMTTEVDWNVKKRMFGNYNNFAAHLTPEHAAEKMVKYEDELRKQAKENKIGYSLRDQAFMKTGWSSRYFLTTGTFSGDDTAMYDSRPGFPAINQMFVSPEYLGVPRWEGTPEENAQMIRSAVRAFGGSTVGFGRVDERTIKLVDETYAGRPLVFKEAEKPQIAQTEVVIPSSCKYVITTVIRQDPNILSRYQPSLIPDYWSTKGYGQVANTTVRLNVFLRQLGYICCTPGFQINIAWGVATGLGEQSRLKSLFTPETGPILRLTLVAFTDLPLPVTNPIDAGMNRFCYTCRKCADACPSGAIATYEEPSWEITSADNQAGNPDNLQPQLFNNPGHKCWQFNAFACRNYWADTAVGGCAICYGKCVFTKPPEASIHALIKSTISTTSAFNGFFTNMDDAFGYNDGSTEDLADFWENPDKYQPLRSLSTNY
jgi:reductive dehalogenase